MTCCYKARSIICVHIVACGLTACGGAGRHDISGGHPSYFFRQVNDVRTTPGVDYLGPTDLTNALPNHVEYYRGSKPEEATAFSDLVVIGTVTDVRPGDAVVYDNPTGSKGGNDEATHPVDFYDAEADGRNVVVTLKAETVNGQLPDDSSISLRMGVLNNVDPDTFMGSMLALGHVTVFLQRLPDGPHAGDLSPAMGGELIGTISEDGTISFPGLGSSERNFVGSLNTVEAITKAVQEPKIVTGPL